MAETGEKELLHPKDMEVIERRPVHLVCIGHVDHGKSSVLGRLFFDTGNVAETVMERIRNTAKELGREGYEFAFVMDQIKEERMRGITIGLAHKKLLTESISFTFADAPGHKDFIKNMLIGASEADCAILVVAADEGIKSQTREHLFLSKMLGLQRVIIAVNKMDLANYGQREFEKRKMEIETLLKEAGYAKEEVPIIPVSALMGDNVVHKSEKMGWFGRNTLFELMQNLPERKLPTELPLRLPVQDVYEISGKFAVIGRISSGTISEGDKIVVLPQNKEFAVGEIFIHNEKVKKAGPNDNVYLFLDKLQKGEIERGGIIGKEDRPTIARKFLAQIIVMNHMESVREDHAQEFDMLTEQANCTITKIVRKIDSCTGAETKENANEIFDNESAIVEIKTEKPIYIEAQNKIPHLSNFRLVEGDVNIGMGICIEVLE
ncbi:MAG: elongation factor 1-alpha [Candidatus Diapherotrites archaeon]|uniref:Elongation factor 1-alpha n=1 Tax=Candidatus Iainarchaeum sp. TaxID=3101447 RepID=A0A8T4KVY7_9ARCH|nr:elongation factor 1-alpha [Candidatus Diapherotrites archaeon]